VTAPVVCLHGFLGSPDAFAPVIAACKTRPQARAPWLPGHGPAPIPAGERWHDAVAAIAAELTAPAILVGYSMGGRLALGVTVAFPERVRALVLVSADWGIADPDARARRAATDASRAADVERRGLAAFVADWEREPIFGTQSPEQIARQRETRVLHDARAIAWALRALSPAAMPDHGAALFGLPIPVHYLAGARDARYAARAGEIAAAHGPGRVRIVPEAGHNLLIEAPAQVAAAIDAANVTSFQSHEHIVGEEP
jgi:2-succinyl-6-hydroxy-2,4-cyclohexadiene-1-carboxylate synthase